MALKAEETTEAATGTGRVGLVLCGCRGNIAGKLDLDPLAEQAGALVGETAVLRCDALCSAEGLATLSSWVRTGGYDRLAVGACAPGEHGAELAAALEAAGGNPYLMQLADLREQCAWVTPDPELAGRKAAALLRGAVAQVRRRGPLHPRRVPSSPAVAVIGAGVAGLQAALALGRAGRPVYLVERAAHLGGRTVRYATLFPDQECGSCRVAPLIDAVQHCPGVEVLPLARPTALVGYPGSYRLTLEQAARGVDPERCVGCGSCAAACPVSTETRVAGRPVSQRALQFPFPGAVPHHPVWDAQQCLRARGEPCSACLAACPFGAVQLGEPPRRQTLTVGAVVLATGFQTPWPQTDRVRPAAAEGVLLTAAEFEALLDEDGPTGGRLLGLSGEPPQRVALLHPGLFQAAAQPADSLAGRPWAAKAAAAVRSHAPQARLTEMLVRGRDLEVGGDRSVILADPRQLRLRAAPGGIEFAVGPEGETQELLAADLAVAMVPARGDAANRELARWLRLNLTERDTFAAPDPSHPLTLGGRGVYVAGCAAGLRGVGAALTDGLAAAGSVLADLPAGEEILLEAALADVDATRCSGCGVCRPTCVHGALALHWDGAEATARTCRVDEILCRGCGACVGACPAGALSQRYCGEDGLLAELGALLAEGGG